MDSYGGKLDPDKEEGWTDKRVLRPEFLQTILLEEDYVKAIPRRGVYIVGAWIRDPLDFYHSIIGYPLKLDRSRLDAYVDFSDVHARSVLSFQGSVFKGKLNMNGLQVGQHLFMCEGAQYQDVDLRGARIDGQVAMTGATVGGMLNMDGLQVGDVLFLRGGADFKKPAQLTYAIIEKNVHLHGSTFHSVDLHGTQVKGDLILGPPAVTWKPEVDPDVVRLDLNAAKVGVLRDSEDSWPEKVELDGFVYDRWLGLEYRKAKSLTDWLNKQTKFRSQPYEQLALILKSVKQYNKANKILFAGKSLEGPKDAGVINKLEFISIWLSSLIRFIKSNTLI